MGLKSRLPVVIALIILLSAVIACREGPYPIPTPTPSFNKTFPLVNEPFPEAGESQDPNLAAARSVFNSSCLACHPDSGGAIGPALRNIGARSDQATFTRVVRDGTGMMPPFKADKVSDADLAAIWEVLNGGASPPAQPGPTPAATKPATTPAPAATKPAVPPATAATQGKKVFDQQCNMCHPGGGAGMGPALTGGKTTEQSFKQVVRAGKSPMPAYGTDRISDSDLEAMWSYIKDLK